MGRIALVAYGSDGDILPTAEVARWLRESGREVCLVGPPEHAQTLGAELDYRPMGSPVRPWFEDPFDMGSPRRQLQFFRFLRRQIARQLVELPALLDDCEAVIGCSLVWGAPTVAEKLGLPFWFLTFCPAYLPSPAHPPPLGHLHTRSPRLNRLLWRTEELVVERLLLGPIADWRQEQAMEPLRRLHQHLLGRGVLLACDRAIAPCPPVDGPPVHQVGYPTSSAQHPLPEDVESFLAAGPPPIYVGFGSMNAAHPRDRADAIVRSVRAAGQRLVLQRGWAGLEPTSGGDDVLVVDSLCHRALFPRMAAVVHHGGAGTIATASRAGVPQVVVPHILDQPWWARRLQELGAGIELSLRRLDSGGLTAALQRVVADRTLRDRAEQLRAELSQTNPSRELVRVLECELETTNGRRP